MTRHFEDWLRVRDDIPLDEAFEKLLRSGNHPRNLQKAGLDPAATSKQDVENLTNNFAGRLGLVQSSDPNQGFAMQAVKRIVLAMTYGLPQFEVTKTDVKTIFDYLVQTGRAERVGIETPADVLSKYKGLKQLPAYNGQGDGKGTWAAENGFGAWAKSYKAPDNSVSLNIQQQSKMTKNMRQLLVSLGGPAKGAVDPQVVNALKVLMSNGLGQQQQQNVPTPNNPVPGNPGSPVGKSTMKQAP